MSLKGPPDLRFENLVRYMKNYLINGMEELNVKDLGLIVKNKMRGQSTPVMLHLLLEKVQNF